MLSRRSQPWGTWLKRDFFEVPWSVARSDFSLNELCHIVLDILSERVTFYEIISVTSCFEKACCGDVVHLFYCKVVVPRFTWFSKLLPFSTLHSSLQAVEPWTGLEFRAPTRSGRCRRRRRRSRERSVRPRCRCSESKPVSRSARRRRSSSGKGRRERTRKTTSPTSPRRRTNPPRSRQSTWWAPTQSLLKTKNWPNNQQLFLTHKIANVFLT